MKAKDFEEKLKQSVKKEDFNKFKKNVKKNWNNMDGTAQNAVAGGVIGAGLGALEGGAIGIAAFGGAIGVPFFLAGAVAGVAVGVGIKCVRSAFKDK